MTEHEPAALRELLANEAHAIWADWWMGYEYGCSQYVTLKAQTHYIDLHEDDKEMYRQQADRYLALMGVEPPRWTQEEIDAGRVRAAQIAELFDGPTIPALQSYGEDEGAP